MRIFRADSHKSDDKLCSDPATKRLNILAIVPYPPNPLRPRTVSMLSDLVSFAEVDLLYVNDGDNFDLPQEVQFRSVIAFRNGIWQRLLRLAAGCVLGKPIVYQYYHSWHLVRYLKGRDLSAYDAVYVERIPPQDLNIKHPKLILDMQDCYSLLVPQLARTSPGLRKWGFKLDSLRVQRYEQDACNRAAKVLCTAERESRGLKSIGVTTSIHVILHSGPCSRPTRREVSEHSPRILSFHGKLTYSPNLTALDILYEQIFRKLNPAQYEIVVAGTGAKKLQKRYPEFRFVGYVDDIIAHLKSTDLSVLPVEVSAGISNKALESLAAGVPVVATPQIAAGLPSSRDIFEDGMFVRELDEFPEAIEAYFSMSRSRKQDIADKCVSYIERLYGATRRRAYLRNNVFAGRDEQSEGYC